MGRLLRYLLGTCAALATLEIGFRICEREIAASASRSETKAVMLEKHGPVEVLFFGTSRLWDDVSPRAFAAPFPGVRAFSLAASGVKLEVLEQLARRFARRPGLRLAFVELSRPQLETSAQDEPAPAGLEAWAARHSSLIAHRASLRGESFERLPGLILYPRKLDGSEIHLGEQLDALLGIAPRAAPAPEVFPTMPAGRATSAPEAAFRVLAVGRELREAGVKVVFVVPPLLPCEPAEDMGAAGAAVAAEFPVWSYQEARLPAEGFRDCGHLNAEGRAAFSRALADEAARAGFAQAMATRSD